MKERSREICSSPRTAEVIFKDYSAQRIDAVHSLTNGTPISLSLSLLSLSVSLS